VVKTFDGKVLAVHRPKCLLFFKRLGHSIAVWTGVALGTEKTVLRFKLALPPLTHASLDSHLNKRGLKKEKGM